MPTSNTPPVLYKVDYSDGENNYHAYFHADDQQDAMTFARQETRRIFALHPDSTIAAWGLVREADKQFIASDWERA